MELRYGINPQQAAARALPAGSVRRPVRVLNGSPSYINMLDALHSWVKRRGSERAEVDFCGEGCQGLDRASKRARPSRRSCVPPLSLLYGPRRWTAQRTVPRCHVVSGAAPTRTRRVSLPTSERTVRKPL